MQNEILIASKRKSQEGALILVLIVHPYFIFGSISLSKLPTVEENNYSTHGRFFWCANQVCEMKLCCEYACAMNLTPFLDSQHEPVRLYRVCRMKLCVLGCAKWDQPFNIFSLCIFPQLATSHICYVRKKRPKMKLCIFTEYVKQGVWIHWIHWITLNLNILMNLKPKPGG